MARRGAGRWVACAAVVAALAASGCGGVNRRFVIESNVPTAQVYIDDRPVGAAPAHAAFEYYGYHKITLVHPDCETLTVRERVAAPWYGYPPFDFLAEVLWPFRLEDVRRYYYELQPARRTDTGELILKGDDLRQRGWALPAPEHPAEPRAANPPATVPLPAPAAEPPPGQALPPLPAIPSVTPAGGAPATGTFLR